MRKIRFTEHQIITFLKSVEAGLTVKMCAAKPRFLKSAIRGQFGYRIYGHSRFCNIDFRRYHWLA
jgi:hypothetical protein